MPPPPRTTHPAPRGATRLKQLALLALSLGLVSYLVWQVRGDAAFVAFQQQPKNWSLLALSTLLSLLGVVVSIIRWYFLVRSLELPFTIWDALRLGFLGQLLNFVSLGSSGGDLFKMVFIARDHPTRRAEAVASVIVDRLIGLYGLLLVASLAIVIGRMWHTQLAQLRAVVHMTLLATLVGGLGLGMILVPGFTQGALSEMLSALPKVGPTIGKLIGAVRMFRRRLPMLVAAIVMSMGVHSLIVLGLYLAARGLPGECPTLGEHFLIIPVSMVVAAIPIFPLGLGAFEGSLEYLYQHLPREAAIARGQGILVAFAYRVISLGIAVLGMVFWAREKRPLSQLTASPDELAAR